MRISDGNWREVIAAEIDRAHARYGAPASTHESYGVLCEEVAELFDAIRGNNLPAAQVEAIQVAAVAIRLAIYCDNARYQERSEK